MNKNYIILSFLFLIGNALPALAQDDDVSVTFMNVGQGNLSILKSRLPEQPLQQNQEYEICIFDMGTGQRPAVAQPPAFDPNIQGLQQLDIVNRQSFETLEASIRDNLAGAQRISIVISHPDLDHYNLLRYISGTNRINRQNLPKPPIRYLILGGNPFKYNQPFKEAARFLLQHYGTHIYFPAIDRWAEGINLLNQAFLLNLDRVCEANDNIAGDVADYAPSRYAADIINGVYQYRTGVTDPQPRAIFSPNPQNLQENAFRFTDPNITVACLGVNPTHTVHDNGRVTRALGLRSPNDHLTDDNPDSLVFKVRYQYGQHGQSSSVMIMGDATANTTEYIRAKYPFPPIPLNLDNDNLRADIYLASHHGSLENGCNHSCFLERTRPRSVITSHGTKYSHPKNAFLKRLENWGQANNPPLPNPLALVDPHNIYYKTNQCRYRHTNRAIFSTMGGDIVATLHQNGGITFDQNGMDFNLPPN